MTATIGAVLLGLQLECAQCHDHKYDPISQADFYRLRAVFSGSLQLTRNQSLGFLSPGQTQAADAAIMLRGDWRSPGPRVAPAVPRVLQRPSAAQPDLQDSGHQRTALARWLVEQPLFARVAVNRIWQQHFGRGLSRTPSDMGVMGEEPSHPELLDWLAASWRRSGWSLKQLHRRILTSAVFRQQSDRLDRPEGLHPGRRRDPENRALWCFPRRRLDAEVIRDALLLVSGQLVQQAGGPGVRPPLPQELVDTLLKDQWPVSPQPADHYRRSIYVFARRNLRLPILEAFDRPDANASCSRRLESTPALPGVAVDEFASGRRAVARFGAANPRHGGDPRLRSNRFSSAFLGRPPSGPEMTWLRDLLASERGGEAELAELCLAILNAAEFQFID